eukprot:5537705-Karenia_brevis.AAC.1
MKHVPISCRRSILRITRQVCNRCADGSECWGILEEGRSKPLLGSVPEGTARVEEVTERIALWERGAFKILLNKVEQ